MTTVLVEPGRLAGGAVLDLAPEQTRHLRVRRARPGEAVRLLDGAGGVGDGVLLERDRVVVQAVRVVPRPPALVLAVGAGDRERFGWLVEKAAELDVTDVIPLESERSAGVGARVRGQHVERLQRRAVEAITQSGAAWAPRVHLPHTLAELVVRHPTGRRWLADTDGRPPARLGRGDLRVLVAVGPEGGWTSAERRLLLDAGLEPVRLGPHTLRFETAAIAAAVVAGLLRWSVSDE